MILFYIFLWRYITYWEHCFALLTYYYDDGHLNGLDPGLRKDSSGTTTAVSHRRTIDWQQIRGPVTCAKTNVWLLRWTVFFSCMAKCIVIYRFENKYRKQRLILDNVYFKESLINMLYIIGISHEWRVKSVELQRESRKIVFFYFSAFPRDFDRFRSSRIVVLLLLHDCRNFIHKFYVIFDPFSWPSFITDGESVASARI